MYNLIQTKHDDTLIQNKHSDTQWRVQGVAQDGHSLPWNLIAHT